MTTPLPPVEATAITPTVSVVVCTYNRASLLTQTLTSLLRQNTRGRSYEIVVVDDGSTDNTQDIVHREQSESDVDIRYIRQSNAGIGNARNCGVAESRAAWIAFIDDDELADENWLHELLTTAEASGADCVGGPTIPKSIAPTDVEPIGTISHLLGHNPTMMGDAGSRSLFDRLRFRMTRIAVPGGGNALIRRTLLNELGGFRLMTLGEDLDFFRRAQQRRARFAIAPSARVYHLIPPERLTPAYLYAVGKRGGSSQAGIDKDLSKWHAYFMAALRLVHLFAITFPLLMWSVICRRRSQVVSRRCSFQFAIGYIRQVMQTRSAAGSPDVRNKGDAR